jgi:divalent metal cation (Fe/Co/Zn/Cd) transporter
MSGREINEADGRRQHLLRRGWWIEVASLTYNAVEVAVSLVAGFLAGSSALISFGLDSAIEGLSAGTLLWRLQGEEAGAEQGEVQKRKQWALYVIAGSFFLLCAFILYDAAGRLVAQESPQKSPIGIGLLCVSLLLNPFLAWAKYTTGRGLDSEALIADSKDTMVCLYQTVVVLAGLSLNATLGWWWADPVAALAIVPFAGREGWKVLQEAREVDR